MNAAGHPEFSYEGQHTLADSLKRYFVLNGFGADGNYDDEWVEVKLGPVPFTIRNTAGRVRAVRVHDLHHIVTEYQTDLRGEMEISAWEVATGCRDFYVAWILNLSGLAFGSMVWPRRTWRAFLRGRRSHNLYGVAYGPELLSQTVDEARSTLNLQRGDQELRATAADVLAFVGYLGAAVPVLLLNGTLSMLLTPIALLSNALRKDRGKRAAAQPG